MSAFSSHVFTRLLQEKARRFIALSETNKTRIRHPRDEEDWLVSRLRKAGEKTVVTDDGVSSIITAK